MPEMTVFFATNRNLITVDGSEDGGPKLRFGPHPADFRVGTAGVAINERAKVRGTKVDDEVEFSSVQLADEVYEDGKFKRKGSDDLFPELMKALEALKDGKSGSSVRRSALVFIPGFNYTFQESIERGALLAHLYSTESHELVPFVFSWPSDGTIWFSYDDDRRDAELSGAAAGRAFRSFVRYLLRQRREQQCISAAFLVAHSMGAYALRYAVQEVVKRPDEVFQLFDVAIIPAADEERDTLGHREKLLPLSRLAGEIVVYTNKRDKPLKFADSPPRMGHHGPPPGTEESFGAPITTVSCEDVDWPEKDETRHQYYRISPEVVQDITAVLNGDRPEAGAFGNRQSKRDGGYRLMPDRQGGVASLEPAP